MDTTLILQIIMIVSAVLMIIAILLQQRGASLGAGFGGSGELYTTRRGLDKNLFESNNFPGGNIRTVHSGFASIAESIKMFAGWITWTRKARVN